ncbi:hypothetical protein SAMN04489732_102345 [Amycolatopsis saalfeldensis]|uniref:Uncharacterized protein n=1 Tax=Amycolatopsis saalfeldensis TaxID=394193 RepID=A0A1H8SZD1_9PSEU|nr:hypothetical protein SAMN04489732_102345 [Amycolatopsis saalfeldensis]
MQVVVIEPGGVRTEVAARGVATANRLAALRTRLTCVLDRVMAAGVRRHYPKGATA